jgi:hypothetical protein
MLKAAATSASSNATIAAGWTTSPGRPISIRSQMSWRPAAPLTATIAAAWFGLRSATLSGLWSRRPSLATWSALRTRRSLF